MFAKYIPLVSILIAILITESLCQIKFRGPRDYEDEVGESRFAVPINGTTGEFVDNKSSVNTTISSTSDSMTLFEPLGCFKCVNRKYLNHYYERGCKPVEGELKCRNLCPKYFDCPKKETKKFLKGCEFKGRVYRLGEKISVDDPCKKGCFCDDIYDEKNVSRPTIRCANVECFSNLASKPNCYKVFESGKCCPREHCMDNEFSFKCNFEGKEYRSGEKVYSQRDPCLECTCNENWNTANPLNSTGCQRVNCYLDSNPKFRLGCLPIYDDKTCCPIEFFCPVPEEHHCLFDGHRYRIGESVNIGRNDRTDCKCVIPPELTCIERPHSMGQTSETPDYIKQFQTLPKIKINNMFKTTAQISNGSEGNGSDLRRSSETLDYIKEFQTLPKIKITNSSEEISQMSRSVSSECPPFVTGGLICSGINCKTMINDKGCQVCTCDKPCPLPKCQSHCRLYTVTPRECPKCQCV